VLTALLVSEDGTLASSLATLLRQQDFELRAATREEAWETCRLRTFDLVLMDCGSREDFRWFRSFRAVPSILGKLSCAVLRPGISSDGSSDSIADMIWRMPLVADMVCHGLTAARGLITGDRRNSGRYSVRARTYLSYSFDGRDFRQGLLVNLSCGGAAIEVVEPLPAGRVVHARFNLPGSSFAVETTAEVRWRDDFGRAGLKFVSMADDSRRRLERWRSVVATPVFAGA
jgi:hypothetical protein